jgi:hypothetical protein
MTINPGHFKLNDCSESYMEEDRLKHLTWKHRNNTPCMQHNGSKGLGAPQCDHLFAWLPMSKHAHTHTVADVHAHFA